MFWPSPTLHVDPSLMTSLAAKSDLQTNDGFGPNIANIKLQFGKYLAL